MRGYNSKKRISYHVASQIVVTRCINRWSDKAASSNDYIHDIRVPGGTCLI